MRYTRSLAAVLLAVMLLPFAARAQEETDAEPIPLAFYTHPTARYNILLPEGWENRSTAARAHLINQAIGAEVYAVHTADVAPISGTLEALRGLFPDLPEPTLSTHTVTLDTGLWLMSAYTLPDGRALTAYTQVNMVDETAYTIAYVSTAGVYPLSIPTDAGDIASASGQAASGFTAPDAAPLSTETIALTNGTSWTQTRYPAADDSTITVWARPATSAAYYALVQQGDTVAPGNTLMYAVLQDFFVTPETTQYLTIGLIAVAAVVLLFALSVIVRYRNLAQERRTLETLANET